jgi:hypothetical protein
VENQNVQINIKAATDAKSKAHKSITKSPRFARSKFIATKEMGDRLPLGPNVLPHRRWPKN